LKRITKIATLSIILLMSIGMVKNSALYFVYSYDSNLFISWFCENKDRPQIKCNGHCKLSKMAQEERNEDAGRVLEKVQSEVLFFEDKSPFELPSLISFDVDNTLPSRYHPSHYNYIYTAIPDKPPCV